MAPNEGGLEITLRDEAAPAVFRFEGLAVAAAESAGAGLWAAVPGLPRPERGLVLNPATGASVTVALFRATAPGVRLSTDAAAALGVAVGSPAIPVEIVALRSVPSIAGGF